MHYDRIWRILPQITTKDLQFIAHCFTITGLEKRLVCFTFSLYTFLQVYTLQQYDISIIVWMFSLINTDGMCILKTIIETCFQITLILTFFIKRDNESPPTESVCVYICVCVCVCVCVCTALMSEQTLAICYYKGISFVTIVWRINVSILHYYKRISLVRIV